MDELWPTFMEPPSMQDVFASQCTHTTARVTGGHAPTMCIGDKAKMLVDIVRRISNAMQGCKCRSLTSVACLQIFVFVENDKHHDQRLFHLSDCCCIVKFVLARGSVHAHMVSKSNLLLRCCYHDPRATYARCRVPSNEDVGEG